mgnify:CR=1 FL=1
MISIHALREEGDHSGNSGSIATGYFYPRPPRGGRPGRKPTGRGQRPNFYPRPPRGGRRFVAVYDGQDLVISIHALREEGDRAARNTWAAQKDFYPRPPRGGRRCGESCIFNKGNISIHALREEGDFHQQNTACKYHDFYPRPPRGGRLDLSYN